MGVPAPRSTRGTKTTKNISNLNSSVLEQSVAQPDKHCKLDERNTSKYSEEGWKSLIDHFKKLVDDKVCEDMENARDYSHPNCPVYYRHIKSEKSAEITKHVTKFLRENPSGMAIVNIVENLPKSTRREFKKQKVASVKKKAAGTHKIGQDVFDAWEKTFS